MILKQCVESGRVRVDVLEYLLPSGGWGRQIGEIVLVMFNERFELMEGSDINKVHDCRCQET